MVATPDVNYKVPTDFHFLSHSHYLSLQCHRPWIWFYAPEITQQNQRNPLLTLIRPRQGFYSWLTLYTKQKRSEQKKQKERKEKRANLIKSVQKCCAKNFIRHSLFRQILQIDFNICATLSKTATETSFPRLGIVSLSHYIYTYIYFWAVAKTLPEVHCYAQILFGFVKNEHILLPVYAVVVIVPATERGRVCVWPKCKYRLSNNGR